MDKRRTPWAKLARGPGGRVEAWHSLIDHSADVAAVLLGLMAQPTIAARLAMLAQRPTLSPIDTARLGALAFLHDIGKANRGFQARMDQAAPMVGHIDTLAWLFGKAKLYAHLSRVLGLDRLDTWFDEGGFGLFHAVFAHHGRPWRLETANDSARHWQAGPDGDPIADLAPMRTALDAWFPDAFAAGPALPSAPAFHHAFAGLLMLADWLASDTAFFPFANGACPDRMAYARTRAALALVEVGLAVETTRAALPPAPDFARVFGVPPRPLQDAAPEPAARLLILEAETGSGKTEAALWRFARLFARGEVDGLYFALPTRVAASQMFGRLRRFRDGLFGPDGPAVLRAVPGQIAMDEAEGHPLPDFGFEWNDDPDAGVQRARWAAQHPKRFLAAQLSVGTIDQALLAAVAVTHAHLRGAALLRHLLVIDEVHASDTYMQGLLGALLEAHLAAGGHALLLSATLGGAARAKLLGHAPPSRAAAERAPYPCLAWPEGLRHVPAQAGGDKHVTVVTRPWLDHPAEVAARALAAAEAGARVLVVRNTVGGAVAVQRALEALAGTAHPALFRVRGVATLHHGRFAPTDRRLLDAEVEQALGKSRGTAGGRIVVGTQTLEQSLDLDADLLLTDLCPIDVLLQRIGRVHRHAGRVRPAGFDGAVAKILVPAERDLAAFARSGRHGLGSHVYEDLRLAEATWRMIEAQEVWRIPAMNRHLVEGATHPEVLDALWSELSARDAAWDRHVKTVRGRERAHAMEAGYALLDRTAPFEDLRLAEERVVTRLGAADRHVVFEPPPVGPFGLPVAAIRLPAHFLRGSAEDAPVAAREAAGGFGFALDADRFTYDRFGLSRTLEPATPTGTTGRPSRAAGSSTTRRDTPSA